jgi:WD40 repeat protein
MLAAGRQDGAVDLLVCNCNNNNNNNNNNDKGHKKKNHRFLHHTGQAVRSVVYTTDGHLLLTGADNGNICIYDLQRPAPVLVHHLHAAHASWILNIQCCADARRFVTLGRDAAIRVWNVGQTSQSLHTFRLDDTVAWTMHHAPNSARMVAGSDDGWLFVYSIES